MMGRSAKYILLSGLIFLSSLLNAGQPDSIPRLDSSFQAKKFIQEKGNFPKKALEVLKQFSISGYYRFVTNYRHLDIAYPNLTSKNNIFVGDDSQMPELMLNISGSVFKNTSFGTDLYIWSPMTGLGEAENVKGLNLGISLFGTYSSPYGDFTVRTGGINWYSLTPFTFQTNKGYDRYSIFERNPWDPNTKALDTRYATFYNSGAIDQDERWGQQAFQGIILEGNRLPQGFTFVAMYGKTQLNGGLSPLPNSSFGGKIRKDYGPNFISLNTFNNTTFPDSLQKTRIGFNVISLEFRNKIKWLQIHGEVGAGRSFVQNWSGNWGEAISLKLSTDIAKRFPTEIHLYRISPDVINNSAAFTNTSFDQGALYSNTNATQPVLPAVASAMVPIGQLTNNRQGVDLNAQINFWKIKISFGYSISMELEKLSSQITYYHPINSLVLAHFWRWNFPSNVGPYNNLSKIYRTVYETLNLTNIDTATKRPLDNKYFNSVEIYAKFKGKLFNRDYYIYYLGQYSSAQVFLAPLTVFTEKALLRTYYHQLELYYVISPWIIWTNYFGFERIIANYDTETDKITRRPKNQTGYSLATGFDIRLSKGAGLYLRQRWMDYKDSSFKNDRYKGFESTVEIKIFF